MVSEQKSIVSRCNICNSIRNVFIGISGSSW